ncbi:MAG: ribosomal protein S18-alanine N-acetyltransferase [Candidatus Rokubacteria bacterium]|nr:ribosomal protein S18-alanine N-acetyltransferase [Candidatus Rokubacteria bacterium]
MTREDLPAVVAIEEDCFPVPWSQECFVSEIDNVGRSHPMVIRRSGSGPGPRVVGYASLWTIRDELWINNLAVHRDYRRRGLGTLLLREALRLGRRLNCSRALLEVRPSNEDAIHLYTTEGFRTIGRRPRYYTDNQEDALVMVARLAAWRRQGWKPALLRR